MILKLGLLSLSLLLIVSLNAQLMQAQPQYQLHGAYPSNDEGWRYSQPQRFDPHQHQRHSHIHHGHGPHHEHEHNHIQGSLMPNCNFGLCGGYGGQQPGAGYGGPGFGYPPRPGYDDRPQPFQPRPGQPHWPEEEHEQRRSSIQPRPQPGYNGNPLQPRPGVAPRDESQFQQFGGPIQPRPGQPEEEHEQRRPSIQPRPQPGGQDTLQFSQQQPGYGGNPFKFSQQQPGYGGNPLQPRPGVAPSEETEFQQSGSPIQPRPQPAQDQGKRGNSGSNTPGGFQDFNGQSGNPIQPGPTTFNFRTAGDTAIRPRPQQGQDQGQFELNNQQRGNPGSNSPNGFQEPGKAEIGNPIQPRPTNEPTFNFQTADDTESNHNPIQPVPGQSANLGQKQGTSQSGTSTTEPLPNIDDKIASIFNTNNFLATTLNANNDPQGSRDPKSEDAKPESIAQRNLFATNQQCPAGTALRNGHCRRRA